MIALVICDHEFLKWVIVLLLPLVQLNIWLYWKDVQDYRSEKDQGLNRNPNIKPPPGDKTLGIDPDIRLYKIEGGDKTEEG